MHGINKWKAPYNSRVNDIYENLGKSNGLA